MYWRQNRKTLECSYHSISMLLSQSRSHTLQHSLSLFHLLLTVVQVEFEKSDIARQCCFGQTLSYKIQNSTFWISPGNRASLLFRWFGFVFQETWKVDSDLSMVAVTRGKVIPPFMTNSFEASVGFREVSFDTSARRKLQRKLCHSLWVKNYFASFINYEARCA